MPVSLPVPTKNPGDVLTSALWNSYLRDNLNKLLNLSHRILTVAQFAALTGLEGTKGTVTSDEVYLEVDAASGVVWHLAYDSSDPGTNKWRCLGGPPLLSEVTANEGTASGTYAALATAGPSIAVPRAGDYDVTIGYSAPASGGTSGAMMSYDIGGTGAVDADSAEGGGGVTPGSYSRPRRKAALTAVTLTAKYRGITGTNNFQKRFMAVRPVRLI